MGWWEQIQNPGKIRKTKTSYGQDVDALNQKNVPAAKETSTESSSVNIPQRSARPAPEPVVPGMDKYSIAAKRLGRRGPPEAYSYRPPQNTYKRKTATTGGEKKMELIELVCQKCRYKVAVHGDLKLKVMESLKVNTAEELYTAIQKNKEKFECTKCKSKNVAVFKSYI